MPIEGRHSEFAFETVIEGHLLQSGYARIPEESFDRERAIFPHTVLAFIRETQPAEWAKLEALHGEKTGEQVLSDLCKWMDANGSLATLRHGFKCYGRALRVAYFKAAHELNAELETRYAANRLGLTRQLHFSPRCEKSLDVTLSLNGIPIVTIELKNPMTGQTVEDACRQYKQDRDHYAAVVHKRRAIVHHDGFGFGGPRGGLAEVRPIPPRIPLAPPPLSCSNRWQSRRTGSAAPIPTAGRWSSASPESWCSRATHSPACNTAQFPSTPCDARRCGRARPARRPP
jgi:type I restriction and modification enzyme subunit R-like protein